MIESILASAHEGALRESSKRVTDDVRNFVGAYPAE